MISAFVFDFDGTILDTETAEFESVRRVFADHNLEVDEAWFHAHVGATQGPNWLDELAQRLDRPIDRSELFRRQRAYNADVVTELAILPGIEALLAADIPKAIASNSGGSWVVDHLARLGLDRYFSAVVTVDHVVRGKPHPEPYLAACAALGADPFLAVAFEDSAAGVRSAVAAGLFTVGCAGPMSRHHDLSEADWVVGSLHEVDVTELARRVGERHASRWSDPRTRDVVTSFRTEPPGRASASEPDEDGEALAPPGAQPPRQTRL